MDSNIKRLWHGSWNLIYLITGIFVVKKLSTKSKLSNLLLSFWKDISYKFEYKTFVALLIKYHILVLFSYTENISS